MHLRLLRVAHRISQITVAVQTGTSIPLVRLYEASNGTGVRNPEKRRALATYYASLESMSAHALPNEAA